jgi:hypothetical protein
MVRRGVDAENDIAWPDSIAHGIISLA